MNTKFYYCTGFVAYFDVRNMNEDKEAKKERERASKIKIKIRSNEKDINK